MSDGGGSGGEADKCEEYSFGGECAHFRGFVYGVRM